METNGKQSEKLTKRAFDEASGGSRRKEAEALLIREVEELKGRAVHMEKTMRYSKKIKIDKQKINSVHFVLHSVGLSIGFVHLIINCGSLNPL